MRRASWFLLSVLLGLPSAFSQEPKPEKLGILLDTSWEMGHLVPRVRKEVRLLNETLEAEGREPIPLREVDGAALEKIGKLGFPARKNAYERLLQLFTEDGVAGAYWLSAMKGVQSETGILLLEKLLRPEEPVNPARKLIIRNMWPEQLAAGRWWQKESGPPELDPFHPKSLPEDWLGLIYRTGGLLLREQREMPAFYSAVAANTANRDVTFWQEPLQKKYGLHFARRGEHGSLWVAGKRWFQSTTVIPFLSGHSNSERSEKVYAEMIRRPSIEADLQKIEGEKIGVLFAMGVLDKDLSTFQRANLDQRGSDTNIVRMLAQKKMSEEFSAHRREFESVKGRVYESIFHQYSSARQSEDGSHNQIFSRKAARMIREHDLDALYLFTNGHTERSGASPFTMDLEPLASYVKEKGTKLYVRVPVELAFASIGMRRLAEESGGAVFFGPNGDPDFKTGPRVGF